MTAVQTCNPINYSEPLPISNAGASFAHRITFEPRKLRSTFSPVQQVAVKKFPGKHTQNNGGPPNRLTGSKLPTIPNVYVCEDADETNGKRPGLLIESGLLCRNVLSAPQRHG